MTDLTAGGVAKSTYKKRITARLACRAAFMKHKGVLQGPFNGQRFPRRSHYFGANLGRREADAAIFHALRLCRSAIPAIVAPRSTHRLADAATQPNENAFSHQQAAAPRSGTTASRAAGDMTIISACTRKAAAAATRHASTFQRALSVAPSSAPTGRAP